MGTYEIHKNFGVCNKSEDENNFMKNEFQIFPVIARDVQKVFGHCNFLLYISYKTTIFQNIIPKSILVRF